MYSADETDLKILELLREDSRLSFREIGKRIGVSTGTVSDRVRSMVANGVIRRFTTSVDPQKLGLAVAMFVRVRVKPNYSIDDLVKDISKLKESCCVHCVTGDLDVIVLVRCTDHDHAAAVLGQVRSMEGVASLDSNVVLKAFPQCGKCWCDCGGTPGED